MSNKDTNLFDDRGVAIGISSGTVSVFDQTVWAEIDLTGTVNTPVLSLDNITTEAPIEVTGTGTIDVAGQVYLQNLSVGNRGQGDLNIHIASNTTLNASALYIESGSTVDVIDDGHASTFENDGPTGDDSGIWVSGDSKLTIGVTVAGDGNGEFFVNTGSTLAFTGEVEHQTIELGYNATMPTGGLLAIGDPMQFIGDTVQASTGGTIDLTNSHATDFSYLNGILKISEAGHTIASFGYSVQPGDAFSVSNVGTDVRISTSFVGNNFHQMPVMDHHVS